MPKEPLPAFISSYKIEGLLEKGGMSLLYLGTHPETHEPVAIKVLSSNYMQNEEAVQHFLKEAEIIAIADHPNIVRLYSQGKWEGGLYIAMEYIEGVSLRHYLKKSPLALKRSLEIILEISYALCHLHSHGIIHRDLKLENIIITDAGTVKVVDFGIAQLLLPATPSTALGERRIIGTPVYMSPEQRDNPEGVSYPSDIYSLGIIAYELITGKLSQGKIHLSMVPKGLQTILSKCLQPEKSARYQDIVDLIADLSDYLNSEKLKSEGGGDTGHLFFEELKNCRKELIQIPSIEGYTVCTASLLSEITPGPLLLQIDPTTILYAESKERGLHALYSLAHLKGRLEALNIKSIERENEMIFTLFTLHKETKSYTLHRHETGSFFQIGSLVAFLSLTPEESHKLPIKEWLNEIAELKPLTLQQKADKLLRHLRSYTQLDTTILFVLLADFG